MRRATVHLRFSSRSAIVTLVLGWIGPRLRRPDEHPPRQKAAVFLCCVDGHESAPSGHARSPVAWEYNRSPDRESPEKSSVRGLVRLRHICRSKLPSLGAMSLTEIARPKSEADQDMTQRDHRR